MCLLSFPTTAAPECGLPKVTLDKALCAETSTTADSESTKRNRRKRVRFECDEERPGKRQHRVLEWLPLCREWTAEEKQARWVTTPEHAQIRSRMSQDATQRQADDIARAQKGLSTLTQTYAQIYAHCHPKSTTTTTAQQQLSNLVTTWAVEFADCRGLEDRTVPVLGLQRRLARTKLIRAVVNGADDAQHHSAAAARLAQALAVVDATAAVMAHVSSSSAEQKKKDAV